MPERSPDLILVLDDRPEIRELLCELLEMDGFQVLAPASLPADPGEIGRLRPALVILDYFLGAAAPGWRLLRRLCTDPATRSLPVLVCTAALPEVRARERDPAALGV